MKLAKSNECVESLCLTCKKSLINDQDDCVSTNVNDKPVKKNVPKRSYAKQVGRLVAKLRLFTTDKNHSVYFRDDIWKPTGRNFTLQNGTMSDKPELPVENLSECDQKFTSNPKEPNSKRFPQYYFSVTARLSKFVFGSSTRVAPST